MIVLKLAVKLAIYCIYTHILKGDIKKLRQTTSSVIDVEMFVQLSPSPQGFWPFMNDRITVKGYIASLFILAKGCHAQICEKSLSCILLGPSTVIYCVIIFIT